MATKSQRTPPPGTHAHLPVTPTNVAKEGPTASGGAQPSLSNPWGASLGQSHPPVAPGQPPQPPPPINQMQGVPAPVQATPGVTPKKKLLTDRRPRTGDES